VDMVYLGLIGIFFIATWLLVSLLDHLGEA
jgi:hypothetical protein